MKQEVVAPWAEPVPDAPVATLALTDSLDGREIVPGFTHPVADLFTD